MDASRSRRQQPSERRHPQLWRRARPLLVVLAVSVLVWPFALAGSFGDASIHVTEVLRVASSLTVLWLGWRRQREWSDRVWVMSLASMALWCATDIVWTMCSIGGWSGLEWVQLGYATAVLGFALTAGYRTWLQSQRSGVVRMTADAAIVATSIVLVWRVLLFHPGAPASATVLAVTITVADAVLIAIAAVRMCATRGAAAATLFGSAAVVLLASDLRYFNLLFVGDAAPGLGIHDLGWHLVVLLIGFSTVLVEPGVGSAPAAATMYRLQQLLPLAAVCTAASVLVLSSNVSQAQGVRAGAVGLFVAYGLRQLLVALEGAGMRARVEGATQALAREARHDTLTGLYRRHVFVDRAGEALRDRRVDGGRLAMLFVDIDGFRSINDRLGHHVGDEVLRQVADRISSCCAPGDVPARMGGDEFVVLRPRAGTDTACWAEGARNVLSAPIGIASIGMQVRVTASIGVVHADATYDDVGVLLADADLAMYRAKQASRDNVQSFSISKRRGSEVTTVAALRQGLGDGAVRVLYQPVVDLSSGSIVGAEALVRWAHPQLGLLSPAEFLPLAEAAGMMTELDDLVLRTAVRDFASGPLRDTGWWVSVNLSLGELADPALVDRVAGALGALDPSRLIIEVQERTVPGPQVARRLAQVAQLGVRLAIDDFGAGPSSFGQLSDLPLHIVKLDRSLVPSATSTHGAHDRLSLVHALVALAHSRGLGVVAEGIEHANEASTMRDLGCEMGQGFLWHRPAPLSVLCELALTEVGAALPH